MEGICGMSGVSIHHDGSQFEDSLRRLHALEKKLTDQVQVDIAELRQKWVQLRVDRVTHNTFKLYQVREHLKHSKVLYVEEEQILSEFSRVKEALLTNNLDDETFEATRETCLVLGGKLGNIRQRQTRCYSDTSDLELVINKDIVALKFEDKDFEDLDINHVRASTPVRQLSPTPLDRHRSRSREPSEFRMPAMKLCTGTTTPGGSIPPDPHAYFSRPGSSQSMYAGKQGGDMDSFRTAMEAKQAEDVSPDTERKVINSTNDKLQVRSASGQIIPKTDASDISLPGGVFESERPESAMSDMSIDIEMVSRPGSKLEFIGDDVSGKVAPLENIIQQQNGDISQTAEITEDLETVKSETTEKDSTLSKEADKLNQENFTSKDGVVVKEYQQIVKDDSKLKDETWGKKKREEKDTEVDEENRIKNEAKVERILNSSPIEKEIHSPSLRKQDEKSECKNTEKNKDMEKKKQEKIKFENMAELKELEENKVEINNSKVTNKAVKLTEGETKKEIKPEKGQEKKTRVEVEEKGPANQEPIIIKTEQSLLVKEEEKTSKEESSLSSSPIKQILEKGSMKVVDNKAEISLSVEIAFEKSEDCQLSIEMSPTATIKSVQGSIDSSKERNLNKNTKNEEITFKPPSKSLSKSGSLRKSSSFNKDKKRISFVDDIDIEKFQVDAEPISLAKEIFAEIANASIEDGLTGTKHEFIPMFNQNEPAEWYPPEGNEFENEDELMLILNEVDPDLVALHNEKSRSRSQDRSACINSEFTGGLSETGLQQSMSTSGVPELETVEVRSLLKKTIGDFNGLNKQSDESNMDSQSKQGSISTGFSHLDEFERRLAEMEQELENEEAFRSQCDPIGEGLLRRSENNWDLSPPPSRANTDNDNNWEETFEIFQKTENMLTKISSSENQDEAPFGEKKTAPFYESENDVQCEYIFDEITGQSIKRYKKVSFAVGEERHTIKNSGELNVNTVDNQETQQPVSPRRSTSKEATPTAFLSAMTGGLIEHTGFVSLVQKVRKTSRSRSRSRQGSRQSSGDRSSQDLGSEDEGSRSLDFCDSASDVGSESSLVTKLKKLTKKSSKVQAADFDALFARGMAMSAGLGSADGKEHLLADKEEVFKSSFKPTGIENNKKVLSYLDDQGQPQTSQFYKGEENDHGHISRDRGRKKHIQQPINQRPVSIDSKARSIYTKQRKRSREYAKPEEIKVSPAPKRDLFTGLLVPDTPEAMFLQRVTDFVAKNQKGYIEKAIQITKNEDSTDEILTPTQNIPERISSLTLPRSPPTLAPSPGKTSLDNTGQEIFGASVEEDLIESNSEPKSDISDAPVVLDKNIQHPTSTESSCLPRMDEPADKGIPVQLMPDKLMANEEFYENLRVGLKSAEEPIQLDTESFQKYSHHLERAEFGTLKKKASTAASRDTSVDRFKTKVVSRDPSADTRFNSKIQLSRQSSKDQVRSDSRMSDYSTALPDLEMDGETATNYMEVVPASNIPMKRTQSLILGSEQKENTVIVDSTAEVLAIREEVLKEMEERKQQIKDTKAWIQNGLMTVVGFGVMAYLQTLEAVAGGQ